MPVSRALQGKWTRIGVITAWTYSCGAAPLQPFAAFTTRPGAQSPLPPRAGLGDAFVSVDAQAQTWTIGNGRLHARFRLNQNRDFVLDQILNPQTGQAFASMGESDSTATINGSPAPIGSASAGWSLDNVATSGTGDAVQLSFTFRSSRVGVVVERSYASYSGSPVIEAWTTFRATGSTAVTVSNVNAWRLAAPATTVHYALGLRLVESDELPDQSFTLASHTLDPGEELILAEQNRSTEQYLPVIAADAEGNEFFGGLIWSGSWQIAVQSLGTSLRASAGVPGITFTVEASRPLETPHGFFGFTPGGRGAVSEALRAFIVQGLRQGRPLRPLVTYNTWFAYGTEVDERTMKDEIAVAATLGVELFVLDAGWYVGAGRGADFDSGLGTWQVDPEKFPNGLAELRAYAHDYGLQFGLWVEPERVDRVTVGRPGLAAEAWLAKTNDDYRSPDTRQVCLASPAARQWVLDQLTRLIDVVQPDYLKWDNNFWVNCNRPGHGHSSSSGNYAHVAALYEVLAALRARYPDLLIENCSQGGNRLDFALLRYSDTGWMDDRTSPAAHVRHNLQGLMTFFPPAYLLSFVMSHINEPIGGAPDLPLYMRSRMPGVLGLTYRSADLTEEDRDGIAREIAIYKRIRDVVRDANGRLVTQQARQNDAPAWDAVQETAASSGDALIFAFQNDAAIPRISVLPVGLQNGAVYMVTTLDGRLVASATGIDLMTDGIEIDASFESAAHVLLLERRDSDTAAVQPSGTVSPGH
jgi:alpha-galactosidase